ncbi:MAG: hypothetical protein DSY42_00590 [Aquifex sp.]|nr:MAG: hypothetical protein DSY42_00590 [Aquifex sp.]
MGKVKVPSAFRRVVTSEQGAVFHGGYLWKIGEVVSGVEYPNILEDLVRLYPLVVKAFARGQEKVAISLPAEAYVSSLKKGEGVIQELERKIKEETGVSVEVYPQGVSALAQIFAETKELDEGALTLVIDGGFNTINIAVANANMNIPFVFTYYNEFGIRDLLTTFAELLRERIKVEMTANLQKLKQAFLRGKVDVGFNQVEVNGEKAHAIDVFIDKLWARLRGDLIRAGVEFEQIVVVGGLAYYIGDVLKEKTNKPVFIPSQDAEFYTAMGMHRLSGLPAIDFGFGDIKLCGFSEEAGKEESE